MKIDAHQHFWNYDPVECSWMDDTMDVLKKDYLPEDLQQVLIENNIDGCISVQAGQSENETNFLLRHTENNPFIKGVVGWVDLMSEDVDSRLIHFKKNSKFCGVRHIVQAEPDGFMLNPKFQNGISHLKEHDLTYDILIYPHQLEEAVKFCGKFPDHKLVIDHIAKPDIKKKEIDKWAILMKEIASNKNVYCKLSGLVTEADWRNWKQDDFEPYLDIVFGAFETEKLMYGSDWPVCLLAGKYKDVLTLIEKYLEGYSEEDRNKVMGLNAVKFYNLKVRD